MLQAENTSEKMELEVGVSNVERPNYSNHEFSAVLFPENPYPATINVDITEKQYPLSPNRNVTSFSIAVADAKNETNVEYITGHVRDGKLEYTSMQPVTL